jgi:hypothetical protein
VETAGEKVRRACELLTSPTPANLDLCAGLLASAAGEVSRIRSQAEAQRLLEDVRHAGALLESAAQFHREWQRMTGHLSGGYQPGGEASPLFRSTTVSVAG